jgi:hypothetical protein
MHGTSIQTPAQRWPYRGRLDNRDFGANLSYGPGARDFAAARQSQSAGTRTSGSSDGLLRDGFGNVDGSQLPGGVAVFADGLYWLLGGEQVYKVTGKSGITQARQRLGWEAMKAIHDEIVRPIAEPHTAGAVLGRSPVYGRTGA